MTSSIAAYCGEAPLPVEILTRWNTDPFLLAGLAGTALSWALWKTATNQQHAAFILFLGALGVIFISPLCALSSALFSARAVHHLLLVAAAAPLLAVAWPGLSKGFSLAASTILATIIFWVWHIPIAYSWALSDSGIYWLMQLSLLGSAVLFWDAVLHKTARAGSAIFGLLAMMAQMGLLGALLTFAPQALYAPHFGVTQPWGLSALEDQQLAGLIMWVVSVPFYLLPALMLIIRGLQFAEKDAEA